MSNEPTKRSEDTLRASSRSIDARDKVDYALSGVEEVTYTDKVRKLLVAWLLSLLLVTIVGGFLLVALSHWLKIAVSDVSAFVAPVFSAVVTLVSGATGYYFASEGRRTTTGDSPG